MRFWIFMFFCNLLIPLIMIIFGRVMFKHPPKSINGVYGYRTSMSMKNMDTWYFAHEVCGKLWWKLGWVMFVPSIVIQLPFFKSNDNIVGIVGVILCTIQSVVLIASISPVEKALKRNFHQDGTKK
jgi:uncharacterized membrane protein